MSKKLITVTKGAAAAKEMAAMERQAKQPGRGPGAPTTFSSIWHHT
jgi:hypothetical protein